MSEIRTPPRRLVDLNPRWIKTTDGEVWGISYDCPCGLLDCENGGRQVVPTKSDFTGKPTGSDSATRGWDLSGDSFENITLSPSIHQVGHWHGFLRSGVLESC